MIERRCSECGQTLPNIRYGVRLGPVAARIFDAIARSGIDGITPVDLFELVYADRPGSQHSALKALVRQINFKFSGLTRTRIVFCEGSYRLMAPAARLRA
jgi:hypothetical protein